MFDAIDDATQRLKSRERERIVNLRIYPALAHYFLLPRLSRFNALYPDFDIRLDTHVEPLDFRGTRLDVAIQLGDGRWKDARSRMLFPERLDVVCSPEYGRKLNVGSKSVRLLHSKYRRRAWADWTERSGISVDADGEIEFETSLLTYSATISGLGLAVGQIDILQRDLDAGTLVTPFNSPQETSSEFHVVWPTTKSVAKQTKCFIDWLLQEASQKPEFFTSSKAPEKR